MTATIEELELDILNRAHEGAGRKLLDILTNIDQNHGAISGLRMKHMPPVQGQDLERHVAVRLANAIGLLFAQADFHLSDEGFMSFVTRQRWIGTIFASTPLRNADHIIRMMEGVQDDGIHLKLDHSDLLKLCVLYTAESDLSLNCDDLWVRTPRLCASLLMALLSPRLTISNNAHIKRELILQWLPSRLDQLRSAADLPQGFIHDVWMHCSYSMLEDKHAIKASLNRLIRRQMLDAGLVDISTPYQPYDHSASKPVLMVMMEWFHVNHSVFRTHSKSLLALKQRFKLVGVGISSCTDDVTRAMFDEFVSLELADGILPNVVKAVEVAKLHRPQIVYYLGVGMFPHTIYAANLRLAPLQCVALGHAASTFSPMMDYFLIDEDFVGDPARFSEKVVALPIGSMPFVLPKFMPELLEREPRVSDSIAIAVAASCMKINPEFLAACKKAQEFSPRKLEFRFVPAFAVGFSFHVAKTELEKQVPGCVVSPHLAYPQYLAELQSCDLFINPFPYGNMNTIVDTVIVGLEGLCVNGLEPHSAIDAALFERLGLPNLHVVDSKDNYAQSIAEYANIAYEKRHKKNIELGNIEILTSETEHRLDDILMRLHEMHSQLSPKMIKI